MSLTLTVHRGTQQIGGSCIEIASSDGERLILDAGRPLDAPRDAVGLLPETLDLTRPAHVLISHPHMDHWGLINDLPSEWPVWAGEKAAALMQLTGAILGAPVQRSMQSWHSRCAPFAVGGFTITPYLTDHSALDAYMLLIEKHGCRLLYTGDFRTHGRKAALVERMIANPPANIDALIMEGTNLNSAKPVMHEADLEDDFVALARRTCGHLFVDWSAQNIDRTVTLYRAARKTGRQLVIDLYTAEVLRIVGEGTALPQPSRAFSSLNVVITTAMKNMFYRMGQGDVVDHYIKSGVATSRAKVNQAPAIVMARKSLMRDYVADDQLPITANDCFVHSNWSGYLNEDDADSGWAMAKRANAQRLHIHTSGHASAADLSHFALAIAPKALVPVHGVEWDAPAIDLPPVKRLADGTAWTIGN